MSSSGEDSKHSLHLTIDGERLSLREEPGGIVWADAPYHYSASFVEPWGERTCRSLEGREMTRRAESIEVRGNLGGLSVEHRFTLSPRDARLEERIVLTNATGRKLRLSALELGFPRRLTDDVARVLPGLEHDRLAAVPFRIRPTDGPGEVNDWSVPELVRSQGYEPRLDAELRYGRLLSRHRHSEAWCWQHGEGCLGILKVNQAGMEYSILSSSVREDGLWLRFGGVCLFGGEPSELGEIAAGESVETGLTRYQAVRGGYPEVAASYRALLDEKGCGFPRDWNPPVHWNELYDNPHWWVVSPRGERDGRLRTRGTTYTRAQIEDEAVKAVSYGCQALYLDPGWDTSFGSFHWDEARLGSLPEFVSEMKRHALEVSLHCPLATWVSHPLHRSDDQGLRSWPSGAARVDREGRRIEGSLCLGSWQYLDEAERRLVKLCEAGVSFLMFDGNWWHGGCWNPEHGHTVPYRRADNVRANLDLARRVHAAFPKTIIEMHDMVAGGTHVRWTPVYYGYGLPGSYDENWGFELMWNPFADLRDGRARALYYYNLACNVPVYLHVDLRDDNEHCLVLWWFASTCRHLGIGGTHARGAVARAQQEAMGRYRALERFFKRGQFWGLGEEIHAHVLPEENALVITAFNLSDERRRIQGSIAIRSLGLDPERWYRRSERWAWFDSERLHVGCDLEPWGTAIVHLEAV